MNVVEAMPRVTMTAASVWTDEDTNKAEAAWAEYQRLHDVSARHGQAVGIDPISGRVWFGPHGLEVIDAARADGVTTPLLLLRVGYPYYQRKGGRR
jgi:hypothetical protein